MSQDTVTIQLRIPRSLANRIQVAAEERVISKSLLVCKAIEHYLDTLPDLEELLTTNPQAFDPILTEAERRPWWRRWFR